MSNETLFLLSFVVFIFFILALDLGLLHKKSDTISLKQAGLMSFFVVCLSLGFYFLLITYGHMLHGIDSIEKLQTVINKHHHPITVIPNDLEHSIALYNQNLGLEYLTGYVVEYALSVDNIFVIVLVFTAFGDRKSVV